MAGVKRDDLSADVITKTERIDLEGKITEERERRRWKTRLLRASAAIISIFYATLLVFIFTIHRGNIEHTHVLVAAILAAVPTLLAVNFLKLVRSNDRAGGDGLESNPWFSLLKELVNALKSK